jgi:hypothetical protein
MPTLTTDGRALEKVVIALTGSIARGASMVVAGFMTMEDFSCWEKAVAEFEGKVSLGVAAAESSGEVVPVDGVDGCFGPFEPNAVCEESVIAKGPADGTRKVLGHRLACHEELYFGGPKQGNVADEVWKGTQLGGWKFVSVAVELGRKR